MADQHELEQAFIGAVHGLVRHAIIVDANVTAVDADPTSPTSTFTCTVQVGGDNGTTYFKVPIRVLIGSQASIMPVPVVGTDCRLAFMDGNAGRPILYDCDQVQDFYLTTAGNTVFNGGQNGGMVKVVDNVNRLNLIEQDINNLKSAFTTWVVVAEDGGAALKAAAATWFGKQLTETQRSDIENTKVQQ